MTREKILFRNIAIFAIGNFGAKFLNFALIPLYSWYLTKSELGTYDLILSLLGFLIPLITLQLTDSIYRWLLDVGNHKEKATIVISTVVNTLLIGLLFSIPCFIAIKNIFQFDNFLLAYLLMYSMISFMVTQNIIRGLLDNNLYAFSGILFSIVMLIANISFLILFPLKVKGLLIAGIISNVSVSIFLIIKKKLYLFFRLRTFSCTEFKHLIKYSLPLIPSSIGWWLALVANRFIILQYLGKEDNGLFAIAARFPSVLVMINAVFYMAWKDSAILTYDHVDKDVFYSRVFNKYMVFELTSVLLLVSSSKILAGLFLSETFFESWKYMPILFLSTGLMAFGAFFETNYLGSKNTIGALVSALLGGFTTILTCYILVPFGLYGVALSSLIGFSIIAIFRIIDTRKYASINIDYKILSILLVCCIVSYSLLFTNYWVIEISVLACSFFIFIFLNIEIIKPGLDLVGQKFGINNRFVQNTDKF